jgi:DNA-binding CsgD family transcriptional regulator
MGGGAAIEGGTALILVLAFCFLAWRLRFALADLPSADDKDMSMPKDLSAVREPARLAAFMTTHGLSRQEMQVMVMLVQRRSTKDIATAMKVAEKTVGTYVSRMLQKTKVPNRAALMALFTAQTPAPAEQGEPASR